MTPAALAALKALAEGARDAAGAELNDLAAVTRKARALETFRAAVSPDVVLALVARIEALELDRGAYDNWIGIYAKAAGLPYDAGPNDIKAAIERLRATVGDAVSAGLALEEAYEMAQRQRHNYEDWGDEQWDPIQEARNRLCAFNEKTGGKP